MDDDKTRLVTQDGRLIEIAPIKAVDAAMTDGKTTQEWMLDGFRQAHVGQKMRIDQPAMPDGTPGLIIELTVTDIRLKD